MWALYSLACRLRTLYTLFYGVVTFAQGGWTALLLAHLPLLGLVPCILLRELLPALPSARCRSVAFLDRLATVLATVSAGGLAAGRVADSCVFLAGLSLRMLFSWS
jgi:hypothetical protein